ncbi:MAG: hypothetical protein AB7P04_07820 [Bacteriovoracia bacterium]
MKKERPRTNRFRLLIFPRFQLVLVGTNLAIMFGVSLLTWLSVNHAFTGLMPAAGLDSMETEFYQKFIDYQTTTMQLRLFVALGLGIVVSSIVTLLISHRFSGPLVRLRGYFQSIADGHHPIPRLEFRHGDFLDDIPPVVNDAIDTIQKRGTSYTNGHATSRHKTVA